MSVENVEIVRRFYDAWARNELPGPIELMDPEIEYVNPPRAVEPGTRRGLTAFSGAVEKAFEGLETWQIELEQLRPVGDQVAVVVRYRARWRESGVQVEVRESALWTVRDGKVTQYAWFHEPADALEAAGCGSNAEVARWTRRGRIATVSPFAGYSTPMISIVAVGTDGSETAGEAVREAAEIARRFGAKLVLLSAFERSKGSSAARPQNVELQWISNSSARVRSILERIEENLGKDGIDCETRADEGDAGEVLVRLAEECGADLLVIGNKGMKRRLLGSVPNTVTHNAGCSVLVVKTT